jgi:hypothetical protein
MAVIFAAALLGPTAAGAQTVVGAARMTFRFAPNSETPNQGVAPSAAFDVALHSDGRVQGAFTPEEPVEFAGRHSAVRLLADDELLATFGVWWRQATGEGSLEGQARARKGAGYDDDIVWDIVDSVTDLSAFLVLSFVPADATEQLTCRPTSRCNTPGPGEPLEAIYLAPSPENPKAWCLRGAVGALALSMIL